MASHHVHQSLTVRPRKMMVGRRSFLIGKKLFKGTSGEFRIRQQQTTVRQQKKHLKGQTHKAMENHRFLIDHLELDCVCPVHSLEDNYACLYCMYLHACVYLEPPKLWHPLSIKTHLCNGRSTHQISYLRFISGATLNIYVPSTYDIICIQQKPHPRFNGIVRHVILRPTTDNHLSKNLQLLKGSKVGKVHTRWFNELFIP